MIREVYQTDRLPVVYDDEEDAYTIQPPLKFEKAYMVNTAVTRFYKPNETEPFDVYEMDFQTTGVPDTDGFVVPTDPYKDCEFEMVFGYNPAYDLPYETVRQETRELDTIEEFDDQLSDVSVFYDAETVDAVDYLRIDIYDAAANEYVTGNVFQLSDSQDDKDDRELLRSGKHQFFPGEFAGYTAKIIYLKDTKENT